LKTGITGAVAGFALLVLANGVVASETASATVFLSVYLEPVELALAQQSAVSTTCIDALRTTANAAPRPVSE
jgi:hypothetical protein